MRWLISSAENDETSLQLRRELLQSADEPLLGSNAVERDEGYHDRGLLHIGLVLGVISVVLVLTELESSCAAEHDVDDAEIAEDGDGPENRIRKCTDSGNEDTCPEDHLAEIVRAADETEQTCTDKCIRIFLFRAILLKIGDRLKNNTECHDADSDIQHGICLSFFSQAEIDRGGLAGVKECAGHPDGDLDADLHVLAVLDVILHGFSIGSALQFSDKEISAQADAVDPEENTDRDRSGDQVISSQDHRRNGNARYREAVSERDEIHILLKSDRADDHCNGKHDEKPDHTIIP